jgi:nitrite reductase/ring-hydroxylating ferredoxin subunit
MIWTDFRDAPAPGTVLAASKDVQESLGAFAVLLTRVGALKAYVNACPHQYLPLNHRGEQVMSADGKTIRCTNHSAGFDAATGNGTEGLGQGCALVPIPIEQAAQNIVVAPT